MKRTRSTFNDNLRRTRLAAGMNSTQLALKSGFQKAAISHFESGRREPTLTNLIRLCGALGCSADVLLGINAVKP